MWARRKIAAADQSGCLLLACIRPSHARAPCRVCVLPRALTTCVLRPQISLSADAEDGENVDPLGSALDSSMELDWAVLLGAAGRTPAVPDGVRRVLCACGRVSDVSRKCLCGRAPKAQAPDPEQSAARAAPSWRWLSL